MPAGIAAGEQAAAEESAFERVVAVVAAAAEARNLACRIEAGNRIAEPFAGPGLARAERIPVLY